MDSTSPREGPSKAPIPANAPATIKEMNALLKEIQKIDPGAKFTGTGQYVALIGSRDWNRGEKRAVTAVFKRHKWKVTIE